MLSCKQCDAGTAWSPAAARAARSVTPWVAAGWLSPGLVSPASQRQRVVVLGNIVFFTFALGAACKEAGQSVFQHAEVSLVFPLGAGTDHPWSGSAIRQRLCSAQSQRWGCAVQSCWLPLVWTFWPKGVREEMPPCSWRCVQGSCRLCFGMEGVLGAELGTAAMYVAAMGSQRSPVAARSCSQHSSAHTEGLWAAVARPEQGPEPPLQQGWSIFGICHLSQSTRGTLTTADAWRG